MAEYWGVSQVSELAKCWLRRLQLKIAAPTSRQTAQGTSSIKKISRDIKKYLHNVLHKILKPTAEADATFKWNAAKDLPDTKHMEIH